MATDIPLVNETERIVASEFVKLTIFNDYENPSDTSEYYFTNYISNSVQVPGSNPPEYFETLGGLLQVGTQPKDLKVTSADTIITLDGVEGSNIFTVLAKKIRGSEIEIWRGFWDPDVYSDGNRQQEISFPVQLYRRFRGIVTAYGITENLEGLDDIFTISLNCSSFRTVLENRVAGRYTNKSSWQVWDSTDSAMNNVYSIADQRFDFGAENNKRVISTSSSNQQQQQYLNYNYGQRFNFNLP